MPFPKILALTVFLRKFTLGTLGPPRKAACGFVALLTLPGHSRTACFFVGLSAFVFTFFTDENLGSIF